jgi:hypothetical protein
MDANDFNSGPPAPPAPPVAFNEQMQQMWTFFQQMAQQGVQRIHHSRSS